MGCRSGVLLVAALMLVVWVGPAASDEGNVWVLWSRTGAEPWKPEMGHFRGERTCADMLAYRVLRQPLRGGQIQLRCFRRSFDPNRIELLIRLPEPPPFHG